MPIAFTNCPACGGHLDTTRDLIPGAVVVICRDCFRYHLKGDDRLFERHNDVLAELEERWLELQAIEENAKESAQTKALIESPGDDPRWR